MNRFDFLNLASTATAGILASSAAAIAADEKENGKQGQRRPQVLFSM